MSSIEEVRGKVKKKGKSAIHKILFSRMIVILLLLAAEIYILFTTFFYLRDLGTWIIVASTVLSIMAIILVVNDRTNPSFKLPWCILLAAAPVVGLLLFLFIKLNAGTKRLCMADRKVMHMTEKYSRTSDQVRTAAEKAPDFREISYYLENTAHNPTYMNTEVTYFPSGEAMWPVLLSELEKAEKFIFVEFFNISADSDFWQSVLGVLERKAGEGVEVRLLYDGMCSIVMTPVTYPSKMRAMGIQCREYEPIKPVLSTDQNNRDHRKIAVIDGMTAFTGGINLSDEYVNITHPFGYWKDAAVMLRGSGAAGFMKMFLEIWNMPEKITEDPDKYMADTAEADFHCPGFVVPYGDGMPNGINVAECVYMDMLNTARKYVHISTPYLVLTNEMLTALTFAARRGVDVKLLLPGIPDKKLVYFIARSYYPILIEAGVKVYQYTPGFNHAKIFVSDDRKAIVGSVNMDFRSFYHHYECAAYLYDCGCIKDIEADFCDTISRSQLMTVRDYKRINILERSIGRFCKIFGYMV